MEEMESKHLLGMLIDLPGPLLEIINDYVGDDYDHLSAKKKRHIRHLCIIYMCCGCPTVAFLILGAIALHRISQQ